MKNLLFTLTFLIVTAFSPINAPATPLENSLPDINETELVLLAKLVFVEANPTIETFSNSVSVAETVLNRVKDTRWPDNIHDVIHQKKQFSGVVSKRWGNYNEASINAAYIALLGSNVSCNATGFANVKLVKSMKNGNKKFIKRAAQYAVQIYGKHTFYNF